MLTYTQNVEHKKIGPIWGFLRSFFTLRPKSIFYIVYPPYDHRHGDREEPWNWLQEEESYEKYWQAQWACININKLNNKVVAIVCEVKETEN